MVCYPISSINDQLEFEYILFEPFPDIDGRLIFFVGAAIYVIWDFGTLLLYIFKIRQFSNFKNNAVLAHKRIMFILYKITIITIFYQMFIVAAFIILIPISFYIQVDSIIDIALVMVFSSKSVAWSLSMYFMMEHDEKEYKKFLNVMYRTKLHFCCCCCRTMVIEQLKDDKVELHKQATQTSGLMTQMIAK